MLCRFANVPSLASAYLVRYILKKVYCQCFHTSRMAISLKIHLPFVEVVQACCKLFIGRFSFNKMLSHLLISYLICELWLWKGSPLNRLHLILYLIAPFLCGRLISYDDTLTTSISNCRFIYLGPPWLVRCSLKVSLLSIITPRYLIECFHVILCSSTFMQQTSFSSY